MIRVADALIVRRADLREIDAEGVGVDYRVMSCDCAGVQRVELRHRRR